MAIFILLETLQLVLNDSLLHDYFITAYEITFVKISVYLVMLWIHIFNKITQSYLFVHLYKCVVNVFLHLSNVLLVKNSYFIISVLFDQ